MSYNFKPKNPSALDDAAVSNVETLGLISLEPRILLDAAGFVTGAEVAAEAVSTEGAELGVQAIFDASEDLAAEPVDGPWLGQVGGDALSAEPVDGPWLGQVGGDALSAEPVDGPWLGQVGDDALSAEPVDGPWLGQVGGDAISDEPVDGPWL